jgi:hypothetical protein
MGNRIGKISTIKKERNSNLFSFESSLAKYGYQRYPGTAIKIEIYKEPNGNYRTGLDENALYIKEIADPELRKIESARVKALREELEAKTGADLSNRSEYYARRNDENYNGMKAEMVKLTDGDNIYDLENPQQAITYAWLRVHPMIARSYQAWLNGEYLPSTQFFVNDEDIENTMVYKKKQAINKAIVEVDKMGLEKRKKIARLLGLPVTDSSREEFVYNLLDNFIKQSEVGEGKYKGQTPTDLFTKFSSMDAEILEAKHLVNELMKHSILRYKRGKLFEGEVEVARSEDELVDRLLTPKHQEDFIAYQEKLKALKSPA